MISKYIAKAIALLPQNLVWIFSRRYIAGKTMEQAVEATRKLNALGVEATIDVLGEFINRIEEADQYKQWYLEAIAAASEAGLKTTFSVKPTMFGLLIDVDFCYRTIRDIIRCAKVAGYFVRMDMEDSKCTSIELELFQKLYLEFPANVGIVLQSYLRRTLDDLKGLSSFNKPEHPINIRLCKGIYVEPEEIAFKKKQDVNDNFMACLDYMMENGFYSAIATHDRKLVKASVELIENKKLAKSLYEFQMLYGVRPHMRSRLVRKGHDMRVYVPFGVHWFNYATRRLQENPQMIWHIMKALVTRG